MSILTKETLAESEIILNRTNIALARSRKLIQSWLTNPNPSTEEEEEQDFIAESETAGIGSEGQQDDSIVALARRRQLNNDKLLEQLLGKQAAKAHQKSREASKPTPQLTVQQSVKTSKKNTEVDDDEDESRSNAVTQGRARKSSSQIKTVEHSKQADEVSEAQASIPRATKRKANSYLDELLAKKAKKKTKGR